MAPSNLVQVTIMGKKYKGVGELEPAVEDTAEETKPMPTVSGQSYQPDLVEDNAIIERRSND